jgi:hypothetical protein
MDRRTVGILFLVGLGLAGLWFLMRKAPLLPASVPSGNGYVGQPLRLQPTGSAAKQYVNKEEWAIDWNEDGLPTKLVISRHATQT